MLTMMGLLGLALAASAFVDFGGTVDDDDLDSSMVDDDYVVDHEMAVSFLSVTEGAVADSAGAGQDAPDLLNMFDEAPNEETWADVPPLQERFDDVPVSRVIDVEDAHGAELEEFVEPIVRVGGAETDILSGELGNDRLDGAGGDDSLWGSVGDDTLMGGAGDDLLVGGDGDDWLEGGEGSDTLQGSFGDDHLIGGDGMDALFGGAGDDVVDGSGDEDADFVNGGRGDDTLIAGSGDTLHGGSGQDTFVMDDVLLVTVDDFDPDEDVIELAYDTEPPELTTSRAADGVNLFADGELMATFKGIDALDIDKSIKLVPA